MVSGVVGDEYIVDFFGNGCRKGMSKLQRLGLPLLDSFLPDVQRGDALLMRYSQHSEVASIDGVLRSSGEVLRLSGEDREAGRIREIAEMF
jgi:hypothetical protein